MSISSTSSSTSAPQVKHWRTLIPGIYRWVRRHSASRLRKSVRLMALLKYGTPRPKRIELATGGNVIFVDPHDQRVRTLLLPASIWKESSTLNQAYWQRICQRLTPDVALDVGANYGENAFCVDYSPQTRVYLFEANPQLIPYLEESLAVHSSRDQMVICPQAVSDSDDQVISFYLNTIWSGTSSLIEGVHTGEPEELQRVEVATTTIDTAVLETTENRGVLFFKMDIEGAEPLALAGMQKILVDFKRVLGWIEYNPAFLAEVNLAPADYLASLNKHFTVYQVIEQQTVSLVEDFQSLVALESPTDLLLIKPGDQSDAAAVIDQLDLKVAP